MEEIIHPIAKESFDGITAHLQQVYDDQKWKDYIQLFNSSIHPMKNRDIINLIDIKHSGSEIEGSWCSNNSDTDPYLI